jgi:hypothetical protein
MRLSLEEFTRFKNIGDGFLSTWAIMRKKPEDYYF